MTKQIQITETASRKRFDLEDRTLAFAKRTRAFVKTLPETPSSRDDLKQLLRSSGSVGANYIEANNALSKKDFCLRLKICRKEAKESRYWLQLLDAPENGCQSERDALIQEAVELANIFSAIIRKAE